jgi:hypothetical protein
MPKKMVALKLAREAGRGKAVFERPKDGPGASKAQIIEANLRLREIAMGI